MTRLLLIPAALFLAWAAREMWRDWSGGQAFGLWLETARDEGELS